MELTNKQTVTRLLQSCQDGDQDAVNELYEFLYNDLYRIAEIQRGKWQKNRTLNTTALLHESYLKLVDQSFRSWKSKAHFLATASKVMRQILYNYARDRNRLKRGGDLQRVSLNHIEMPGNAKMDSDIRLEKILILEKVLKKLDEMNSRQSQIIECRVFGGMTIKETALALEISPITVNRGWKMAQLWISREIHSELENNNPS